MPEHSAYFSAVLASGFCRWQVESRRGRNFGRAGYGCRRSWYENWVPTSDDRKGMIDDYIPDKLIDDLDDAGYMGESHCQI